MLEQNINSTSFNSKECFINGKKFTIEEFNKNEKLKKKYENNEIKLFDKENQELIFSCGKKSKTIF